MSHFKFLFSQNMYGMYKRRRYTSGVRKYGLAKPKGYVKSPYARKRFYRPFYNPFPRFPISLADQPPIKYAKLNYVKLENVNGPGIGSIVIKEYRVNGMFDPEVALGGHQPMGFDELMGKYEKFTVLKCKIEVEAMTMVTYKNLFLCLALENTPGDVASEFSSGGMNGVLERFSISRNVGMTATDRPELNRVITLWADMSKWTGKSYRDLIGDYGYQGDVGHDPDTQYTAAVVLYDPVGADQSAIANAFKVKLTYYAAFTKRTPTDAS